LTAPLTLRIAGEAANLTTARSFVGSIGRVLGMDDGPRHDLRLAVSELATVAIASGSAELTIEVDLDDQTPVLRMKIDGMPPVPPHLHQLLGALLDESSWSVAEPWAIRLVVDSPP
jgi:hypothetical protein